MIRRRPTFKPPARKLDIEEARKLGIPVYWSKTLGRFVTIPA